MNNQKIPGHKNFQNLITLDREWDLKNNITPALRDGLNVFLIRFRCQVIFMDWLRE